MLAASPGATSSTTSPGWAAWLARALSSCGDAMTGFPRIAMQSASRGIRSTSSAIEETKLISCGWRIVDFPTEISNSPHAAIRANVLAQLRLLREFLLMRQLSGGDAEVVEMQGRRQHPTGGTSTFS